MAILFAIVALCLSGSALAATPAQRGCPAVETQQNFDVSRYLGQWYEYSKYFAAFEGNSKCVIARYSNGQNGLINVVNSYVSGTTGQPSQNEASLRIPNAADASKLKIRYPSMPAGIEGDYFVLGTDYESFAVVYSCSTRGQVSSKHAWILTRDQNPSQDVVAQAEAILEKNNINKSGLVKTEQNDC